MLLADTIWRVALLCLIFAIDLLVLIGLCREEIRDRRASRRRQRWSVLTTISPLSSSRETSSAGACIVSAPPAGAALIPPVSKDLML
jgi:hypothetical protein